MKTHKKVPAIILTTLAVALTTACTNASETKATVVEATTQTQVSQLPTEVVEGLKLMYEEEKLASDVYKTLYDKWKTPAFSNIYNTELRHQQAVKELINTYGIAVDDKLPIGEFDDEHLQQAYDDLIKKGMQSEENALIVGAYVEELDIQDLNRLLKHDNPADIASTYEWLNMGSRNHLRGFVNSMQNRGIDYKPQLLTEEEYLAIINSDHERGGGKGNGRGQGGGHGKGHGKGYGQGNG